ncbi:MAG: prepilin peptidase, partial [Candidatus Diapherotrites archaeon]|nr:prepilin peptidase [Candidatus Diapherotrites archaeon]
MIQFLFFFTFSIAALAIAAYTDLKERVVKDEITYSMAAVGLLGHLIATILQADVGPFLTCIAATIAAFAFSLLLYKLGVWAGGDVKLFTGIAALNPVNASILARLGAMPAEMFGAIEIPVFFLTLFIFSIFAMLPYGIFLALRRLSRNREHGKKLIRQVWLFAIGLAAIGIAGIAGTALGMAWLAGLLSLAAGTWLLYFLLRLYGMSAILMRKAIRITELKEGEIVAETIVETAQGIERQPEMGVKNLIKHFAVNKMEKAIKQPREIVSSRKARGATQQEIEELKRLVM